MTDLTNEALDTLERRLRYKPAFQPTGEEAADTIAALRAELAKVREDAARERAITTSLTVVARDVLAERGRQVTAEGWTPEHDDEHADREMALAAACYALSAASCDNFASTRWWPWKRVWWKPSNPRRDLVKAGALILAEIERLDRAAAIAARTDANTTGAG